MIPLGTVAVVARDDGYVRIARGDRHARRLRGRGLRKGHAVTTARFPIEGYPELTEGRDTVTLQVRIFPNGDPSPTLGRYLRESV